MLIISRSDINRLLMILLIGILLGCNKSEKTTNSTEKIQPKISIEETEYNIRYYSSISIKKETYYCHFEDDTLNEHFSNFDKEFMVFDCDREDFYSLNNGEKIINTFVSIKNIKDENYCFYLEWSPDSAVFNYPKVKISEVLKSDTVRTNLTKKTFYSLFPDYKGKLINEKVFYLVYTLFTKLERQKIPFYYSKKPKDNFIKRMNDSFSIPFFSNRYM